MRGMATGLDIAKTVRYQVLAWLRGGDLLREQTT